MDKNTGTGLVSIIIPVYNRETLVGKSIECSIAQTYKNIEIIIVDNCSTDGTWDLLKIYADKDDRIKIFQNSENVGPVKNWLECIRQTKGEYIKFLFSDDWFDVDYIEKAIGYLRDEKEVGLVFSKVMLHQDGKVVTMYDNFGENKIFPSSKFIYKYIRMKGNVPVSPACALFRKHDVDKSFLVNIPNAAQIYYPRTGAGNDVLLFLLTASRYKNVAFINNTSCHFVGSKDSITRNEDLIESYLFATAFFLNSYKVYTGLYKMLIAGRYLYYLVSRKKINLKGLANIYFLVR